MRHLALVVVACVLYSCARARPAAEVDSQLASEIDRIKAVDNHAHPAWGDNDHDYDALPVDEMQPAPLPAKLDPANTDFKIKRTAKSAAGVLDAAGIDIMLANRVTMSSAFDAERFKWVPFADALMYPCNNESLGKRDPDRKTFFAAEEKLL